MRVFLINLDRDVGRLVDVTKRLTEQGIEFERVGAVYGKELSAAEKRSAVCRWRWRLSMGRRVFDGEIGCALSHFKIYQKMIDEKISLACVFEDDAIFLNGDSALQISSSKDQRQDETERGIDRLREIEQFVDTNKSQVVLLSDHGCSKEDRHLITRVYMGMATDAYVITLPAAKSLLGINYPMRAPCDHWSRFVKLGSIELYRSYPELVNQAWDVYESHIKPKAKEQASWLKRGVAFGGHLIDQALLKIGL